MATPRANPSKSTEVFPIAKGNKPELERPVRDAVKAQVRSKDRAGLGLSREDIEAIAGQVGIDEETLDRLLARFLKIPIVEKLPDFEPSSEFVQKVPISFARQHRLVGFMGPEETLWIAMAGIEALPQVESVGRLLMLPVKPCVAPATEIENAIERAYRERNTELSAIAGDEDLSDVNPEGYEDLLDSDRRSRIIKLVNWILLDAVKQDASDIHFQPTEDRLLVRYRIDGILFDLHNLSKGLHDEIVSRIKIMCNLNIAERRLAQDGRASVLVGKNQIDLRISTIPVSFGERVVVRLLDKGRQLLRLGSLGMESKQLETFNRLIRLDHGLILVTGPTGSGKSTTLYAVLQEIKSPEKNILTIEDPIEYHIKNVSQAQVGTRKGMNFASGLRSVLRQDPDIVMVGEIRDRETAVMAVQSSLTGHLVLSTLHTNDAPSAIARLIDLGIEPYLVASSLKGVLAQRLIRKICTVCAHQYNASPDDMSRIGLPSSDKAWILQKGQGCDACRETGYRGRTGIFELLVVDDAIQGLIQKRCGSGDIAKVARDDGMRTLREDGRSKIRLGVSTLDEVLRVTSLET